MIERATQFKSHHSAQELADLALSGFPATKRGVNIYANENGWNDAGDLIEWRKARGGTYAAFSIELLPSSARLDYLSRFVDASALDSDLERSAAENTDVVGLSNTGAGAQAARVKLVSMADRFAADGGLAIKAADALFCDLYNGGGAPVSPWIVELIPSVSARTVQRWRAALRSGKAQSLCVDRSQNRKGSGVLDLAADGQIKATALGLIAKNPHLSAKHIRVFCRDKFSDEIIMPNGEVVAMPTLRTFQQRIKVWKRENAPALLKITNPDAFKSGTRFVATGSTRADRLNECWEIDASPADVMTKDGRHSIYAAVDIYSRRLFVYVTKTPRASAVAMLIRKCISAWGVPEKIKTDNGSDFKARSTQHMFAALDIDVEYCAPYSPEQKGVVERNIGTYQRDLCTTLPGFIGHSVAHRKAIESRKSFARRLGEKDESLFGIDLTAAELQDYTDRWCQSEFAHKQHAALKGKTPFEMAAAYIGQIRTIENEAALDVLLAPVAGKDGRRTVTSQGIRIDGEYYLVRTIMPGTEVFLRQDPHNLGSVFVFEPDGETYLETAVCPGLAGLDPAETIAKVRAAQAAHINEQTAAIRKSARKIGPRDVVDARLRVAERDAGNVVSFPQASESHETPALSAAADAAKTGTEANHSAETLALHEQMKAEPQDQPIAANANVTPLRTTETKEQKYRRALELKTKIEAGETVDPNDAVWLGAYQSGAEYRAMKSLYEAFGDEALRK